MRTLRHVLRALGYGSLGAILILVVGFVLYLDNRPDLDRWHEASLDAEFEADSEIREFEAYLALEDRLFAQLKSRYTTERRPAKARASIDTPGAATPIRVAGRPIGIAASS